MVGPSSARQYRLSTEYLSLKHVIISLQIIIHYSMINKIYSILNDEELEDLGPSSV